MFGDWHGQFAADEIIDGMLEKGVKDIKAIAVSAGYPGQGVCKLIVAHRVHHYDPYRPQPGSTETDAGR